MAGVLSAADPLVVLVETESFDAKDGWKVDTQSVEQMGSVYVIAHGMGTPVADATSSVAFPETGDYRVWVRTRDWVPGPWTAPGRFKVAVDGVELAPEFGTASGDWHWHDGGTVAITTATAAVALRDLTGFDGRCDALAFIKGDDQAPPAGGEALKTWRRGVLNEAPAPGDTRDFDCVVVGGGMAGCCAAIAAARSGVTVALVQDRPFLGGNASEEVRVGTRGEIRHSIVDEIDTMSLGNGDDGTIGADANRLTKIQAEPNITLLMPWRAGDAATGPDGRITHVDARHTHTGERVRLQAPVFIDCTGDGWIGFWAGADYRVGREGAGEFGESRAPSAADAMTMGNSLMWKSRDAGHASAFPPVPWAMDVAGTSAATSGGWNWEYGMELDTIADTEQIRDHLLRAIYGNFSNAKQNPANANRELDWVPFISGKRESRRLMGDHIIVQGDVTAGVFFEDAVGTSTWGIDLHYPTSVSYRSSYTSTAVAKWYFPFRSLYSRSVPNLMMAGRCISVSHVGLGSPRVQNTTGQMGVAVGYAASICKDYGIEPRDIYRSGDRTLELQARIGGSWPERPPVSTAEVIADNADGGTPGCQLTGTWTNSTYDGGYYGSNYSHDGNSGKGSKKAVFVVTIPESGTTRLDLRWTAATNRASNVPVWVQKDLAEPDGPADFTVNQRINGGRWNELTTLELQSGDTMYVILGTEGTNGHVIADAVRWSSLGEQPYPDRDGDLLPDWWERWYFLSETLADPDLDPDRDGRDNYAEYLTGTDPLDARSFFNARMAVEGGLDTYTLRWPSAEGRTYRIETTHDLKQAWVPLLEGISATPPENTQPVVLESNRCFFRVALEE